MRTPRLHRVRRVELLVSVVGLALATLWPVAAAWASPDSEGCLDHHALAMEAIGGQVFSAPMSFEGTWSFDRAMDRYLEVDDDGDVFASGMSCEGPSSCSPQLVFAIEQAHRMRDSGNSGPMCIPGDPDCNVSPGQVPPGSSPHFQAPLVPCLTDLTPRVPVALSRAMALHRREQALFPQDVLRRIERPPCQGRV